MDNDDFNHDIAIIGIGCRFPGADNVEEFWRNLERGGESITFLERGTITGGSGIRNKSNFVPAGALLPGVDLFDAAFFGYSAREAEIMDPQQRLFLECAWEAFEDGGYVPGSGCDRVGVYASCGINTYLINNVHPSVGYFPGRTFLESLEDFKLLIGNEKDFIASRVSHRLNLRGPSINVQTACSSSLTALHLACQSLLVHECDMALAGASTIRLPQESGYLHEEGMVFSPDGHTRCFDADAGGTIFGSGVGAVLLKRLSDAHRDGDDIYAVIKGSAINNDGSDKAGFTAPSIAGQIRVIKEALLASDIDPCSVGYIEAHGTATELGDPMELAALAEAYGASPRAKCAIGSVKSNLGHLSWSAGMAGLCKVASVLKHGKIPPTLHFKRPNPKLGIEDTPFYVNATLADWPADQYPRRAALSAFGLGGTNAHVVLEQAPEPAGDGAKRAREWYVFALSARDSVALCQLARRYLAYLREHPDTDLGNLCYTNLVGRRHFPSRLAFPVCSVQDVAERLCQWIDDHTVQQTAGAMANHGRAGDSLGFLFGGQGLQHPGMGKMLYATSTVFRDAIDACASAFHAHCDDVNLTDLMFSTDGGRERLDDIRYGQAAQFAFQYALSALWLSWGVKPNIMMGHSAGEYVAACIAGVFRLEDAIMLCVARGECFYRHVSPEGKMMTVLAVAEEVAQCIDRFGGKVSVAAINGPLSTVISGPKEDVDRVGDAMRAAGYETKPLLSGRAGHSALVEPLIDPLRQVLGRVDFGEPRIAVVSNVTGSVETDTLCDPEYWLAHVRQTVHFEAGIASMRRSGVDCFLEISPEPALSAMGMHCPAATPATWIAGMRRTREGDDYGCWRYLCDAVARLYEAGVCLDWPAFTNDWQARRVHLPTYPFQGRRHWLEPEAQPRGLDSAAPVSTEGFAESMLHVVWEPSPLGRTPANSGHGENWLILHETGTLAGALEELIARSGSRVRSINVQGASRWRDANGDFASNRTLTDLVVMLKPDRHADHCEGEEIVDEIIAHCERLVEMVKEVLAYALPSLRIWLITREAQIVNDADLAGGVVQAPLWAVARVIGMEHPELECTCIDIPVSEADIGLELIHNDMRVRDGHDRIAYRGGRRFVARLRRFADELEGIQNRAVAFDGEGSYLVVGGLRGVGLLIAQWLCEKGAKNLILAGRSTPSPATSAVLESMRRAGAVVTVAQCDIADFAQCLQLFETTLASQNMPLAGIFHAAGVLDDGTVESQTREKFGKVLSPKAQGAWNLHTLSKRHSPALRQFVMFSSAASLIGNAGQANHAAANAFLDALCHYRHRRGLPATSVNWGAWWEIGELLNNTVARTRVERIGFKGIANAVGVESLELILRKGLVQAGVVPMDWSRFLGNFQLSSKPFFQEFLHVGAEIGRQADSEAVDLWALSQTEREEAICKLMVRQVEQILGVSKGGASPEKSVDPEQPLGDYGLDSLCVIELKNKIRSTLGLIPPSGMELFSRSIAVIANTLASSGKRAEIEVGAVSEAEPLAVGHAQRCEPLSWQQRRWLKLIAAGYGKQVVPLIFHEKFDDRAFQNALRTVVGRHALLRYVYVDGNALAMPTDRVLDVAYRHCTDLRELDERERAFLMGRAAAEMRESQIDLTQSPSWQVRCFDLSEKKFMVLLLLQHIDFDGTSMGSFINELRSLYSSNLTGLRCDLAEPRQYAEYARSQQGYSRSDMKEDRAFFAGLYASLIKTTALDRTVDFKKVTALPAGRLSHQFPGEFWKELQLAAKSIGVTPFSIFLAAYAKLLSRATGQPEPVIAVITSGRTDPRFAETIGPFTAPFPIKIQVRQEDWRDLAMLCNNLVQEVNARSSYPVADLRNIVPAFREFPEETYFTDACINFMNYRREAGDAKLEMDVLETLAPIVKPEFLPLDQTEQVRIPGLHLIVDVAEGNLRFTLWYHLHRFSSDLVSEWLQYFLQQLRSFASASKTSRDGLAAELTP